MAFSDDFSGALLADGWSVEGPATISSGLGGDGTDAWFELTTSTQNHDIWNTNRAARVMQDVADEDFSLEARFLSTPTQRYQMQGYLVEQDAAIDARDFRGRTAYRIAEGAKQSFQFQSWPETADLLTRLGANTKLGIPGTVQERLRDLPVFASPQP